MANKGLGMHRGDLAELTEQLIDLGGSAKVYECSLEALAEFGQEQS